MQCGVRSGLVVQGQTRPLWLSEPAGAKLDQCFAISVLLKGLWSQSDQTFETPRYQETKRTRRSGILLEEGLLDTIAAWRLIARAPSPGPNAFLQDLASCNHATVHHLQTHTLLPGHAIAQQQATGNEWGKVACANLVFASVGFRCTSDPVHRANNRCSVCMRCHFDRDCEQTADFAGQHTLIGISCLLELVYRLSIVRIGTERMCASTVGPKVATPCQAQLHAERVFLHSWTQCRDSMLNTTDVQTYVCAGTVGP